MTFPPIFLYISVLCSENQTQNHERIPLATLPHDWLTSAKCAGRGLRRFCLHTSRATLCHLTLCLHSREFFQERPGALFVVRGRQHALE